MSKQRLFLGFSCPKNVSTLFGADKAPSEACIMISSQAFLRADVKSIFIVDYDLHATSHSKFLELFVKQFADYRHIALRVYKTKQGFRAIGLQSVPPPSRNSRMLYESDCDDRYILVSIEANRYSCRLTPKPLRLGLSWSRPQYLEFQKKPLDAKVSSYFEEYERASRNVAVCSFVSGPSSKEPFIAEFIAFHDKLTKAHESLPLA